MSVSSLKSVIVASATLVAAVAHMGAGSAALAEAPSAANRAGFVWTDVDATPHRFGAVPTIDLGSIAADMVALPIRVLAVRAGDLPLDREAFLPSLSGTRDNPAQPVAAYYSADLRQGVAPLAILMRRLEVADASILPVVPDEYMALSTLLSPETLVDGLAERVTEVAEPVVTDVTALVATVGGPLGITGPMDFPAPPVVARGE